MNETQVILWGVGTSRTIRPIWVAEELELSYVVKSIGPRTGETQTDAFTKINPKQKIPLLQDNDFYISESPAICRYLINQYGTAKNITSPISAKEKAREDEWLSFIYGELDETSLYVIRRHGALASIYGEANNAIEAAKSYFLKHVSVAEHHLKDRQFLIQDKFGIADIFLTTCLVWAEGCQIELSQILREYLCSMTERPGYKSARIKNNQ
jgi:glutathione S-transferase